MFASCNSRKISPRYSFQPPGTRSAARRPPLGCLPSWSVPKGVFCGRHGTGMLGHSHSALCWQGLKCRGPDLGRAECIRCCARRLAPLNCCHTFNGRDSSNSADQTRRSPPTAPGRHQPNLSKSTSKHGATFEESAVAGAKGGAHLVRRTQKVCHTGLRGSNPAQPPESPRLVSSSLAAPVGRAPPDVAQRLHAPPTRTS